MVRVLESILRHSHAGRKAEPQISRRQELSFVEFVQPNYIQGGYALDLNEPFQAKASARPKPLGGKAKRFLDIAISVLALISLAPIMIALAVLVYITNGRPILFAHERVGFDGVKFKCYKFRTMIRNAQEALDRHLMSNPSALAEWELNRKLRNDPRTTPFGNFLRKSSLDELPQIFNIIAGDMACVGPRPIVESELVKYGLSARYYLRTRPGLTGLWQTSGRSDTSYKMRVALDRKYVNDWSLELDVLVLLKTVPAVLRISESR